MNKFKIKLNAKRDEPKVYNNSVPAIGELESAEKAPQKLTDLRNVRDLNKMIVKEYETLVDLHTKRAEIAGETVSISSIPISIRRAVLPIDKLILQPKEYISIQIKLLDESTRAAYNKAKNGGTGQINQAIEAFVSKLPHPPSNLYKAALCLNEIAKINNNNSTIMKIVGKGGDTNPPDNTILRNINENISPWSDGINTVDKRLNTINNIIEECIPCFFDSLSAIGKSWDVTFDKHQWFNNWVDMSIIDAINALRNMINAKLNAITGMSFSRHLCAIQSAWDNKRCLPEIALIIASIRAMINQAIEMISKIAELGIPSLDLTGSLSIGMEITLQAFTKILLDQAMQVLYTITNLIDCTVNHLNNEARKATEGLNAIIDGWNDTGGTITNRDNSNKNTIDYEVPDIQMPDYTSVIISTLQSYRIKVETIIKNLTEAVKQWTKAETGIPIDLGISKQLGLVDGYNKMDILDIIKFYNSLLFMFLEIQRYVSNDRSIDKNVCAVAAYVEQPWINIIADDLIDTILGNEDNIDPTGDDKDHDGNEDGNDGYNDGDTKSCTCENGKLGTHIYIKSEDKWTQCDCGKGSGKPIDPTIDDNFVDGPVDQALTNGFIDDILKLDKTNIIDMDLINNYKKNMKSLKVVNINNQVAFFVGNVSSSKCIPNMDGLKSIFDIKDWSKG